MNRIRALLTVALLALVGICMPASATASVVTSTASGAWKQSCYPKSGTYASLLVENYNITTGQRFKITVRGDSGPTPDVWVDEVYFDGVRIYNAPDGSDPDARVVLYRDRPSRTTKHTVTVVTFQPFDLIPNRCSVGPR